MVSVAGIRDAIIHLVFPHVCCGCMSENLDRHNILCMRCMAALPETHFEILAGNPVEKRFWGRLQVEQATAQYYFTRESLIQQLMHQFKYKKNREIGYYLGKIMGESIRKSGRFPVDALVPLPLFASREKKRGYNQSAVLCDGMAESLKLPVLKDVIIRSHHTETQTRKGRIDRWQNMEGKFELVRPNAIKGKHLLLVDDVITTGATLEACGTELLTAGNVKLSVATLCSAGR